MLASLTFTLIIIEEGADLHCEGCSAPKYYATNLHAGLLLSSVGTALVCFSTIENWSKEHVQPQRKARHYWQQCKDAVGLGLFGATFPYPSTIMNGDSSNCGSWYYVCRHTQDLDTGCKVITSTAPITQQTLRH